MRIIKPPEKLNVKFKEQSLFLAGSIEMGKAELWQDRITEQFKDAENVVILNPRRDDWDGSWAQVEVHVYKSLIRDIQEELKKR